MLVRLWWKEARVFGPIWLILIVAASGLQWLLFSTRNEEMKDGSLTFAALFWAVLYAFAVGSAAFSAERESKTLGFLDALPVGRVTLWLGKVSFAFVSTIGLVLFLIGLAELGTALRQPSGPCSWWSLLITFGPILFEGLAWGLFWSAFSRSTLFSAVLAIVSLVAVSIPTWDLTYTKESRGDLWAVTIQMIVAAVALAASLIVLAWRPSWGWTRLQHDKARKSRPMTVRTASTGRSLFWQGWREGNTTAVLVALLALFFPVVNWLQDSRTDTQIYDIFLVVLATLFAGVSVFGTDGGTGSRGFLVHHGVKASAVWWRRLLAWSLVMAAILGLLVISVPGSGLNFRGPLFSGLMSARTVKIILFVISVGNAFAIGVLCGMMIPRRITAALVGTILWVALVPIQFGLLYLEMIPSWSLVLIPSILLAVSAAWAGDWLHEPEGFDRWGRLGLLIVVSFGLLGGAFVGYRALGVPDIGPPVALATIRDEDIPPGQNAAEVYRQAIGLIRTNDRFRLYEVNGMRSSFLEVVVEGEPNAKLTYFVPLLTMNEPAINRARQASTMPRCRFESIERMTLSSDDWKLYRDLRVLADFLGLEAFQKLNKGDLTGAWDDILAELRMANHLVATNPTYSATQPAALIHHRAVSLAFDWLADPHQSPATVRKALADLKALPPLPTLDPTLRIRSLLIERALDLPGDELAALLVPEGRNNITAFDFFVRSRFMCAPWERQRARRICRRILAEDLPNASVEPWQRQPGSLGVDLWRQGSLLIPLLLQPVAQTVYSLDAETVGRRALDQAVALVAWKLDHGGKDADKLDEIVPGYLEKLPLDPYSGKPFGYDQSDGRTIGRPRESDNSKTVLQPTRVGQRILYSVGMSRSDGKTTAVVEGGKRVFASGDFLFPIP